MAQRVRTRHGLGEDAIDNATLSELVGAPVPLQGEIRREVALGGGLRNGLSDARTHVLVPSRRIESQRFFLARLIGAAHVLDTTEHLLPVTSGETALQKLERSFAQELLCPWAALDAFTNERGIDNEAIADAAEHFAVSEWLIRTALVNRGKMPRGLLPHPLR